MRMGACKACYAVKRTCQYSTGVYQGCIQCTTGGTKCEPRERPSSKYTMDVSRHVTGSKGGSVTSSALGLYMPESMSSGTQPVDSDPALFDDRGFDISSRARRRRLRASHSVDASVSIGAVQVAGATTLVRRGWLQPSELVELYHLFITRWNPCILVLDPCLHTLQYLAHSELLLCVVLAVAAQEYHPRPQLYEQLMHRARSIAGRELLDSPTVDTIQALLLLSLFPDWGTSLDQNRSWLDLGLALDLANQLEIGKIATTFNHRNTSPTERNIFRTWMLCHNLDVITALVFDRPSSLGLMPPECKRWPKQPNDSYEGTVGVLTEPLQLLEVRIKQQSLNKMLYGAESIPGINPGGTLSTQWIGSETITAIEGGTPEQGGLDSHDQGEALPFWLHMANIATAYSQLLLLSKYPSADHNPQDLKSRSNIFNLATSILKSYNRLFEDCSFAKYAPGCLFAYGLLAISVIYKLIGDTNPDASQARAATLIERFSNNLQRSPTVTRADTNPSIFIRTLGYIQRNEPHRAGGIPESLTQEPFVPILTTIFPGWWRLYL